MEEGIFSIVITCLSLLLILTVCVGTAKRKARVSRFPAGPKAWPVIGNLMELGEKPHKSLAELSMKHGPVMGLKLGQVRTVVISNSATIKEALQTDEKSISDRAVPEAAKALNHSDLSIAWIPANESWRTLRKFSHFHLFSGKALEAGMETRKMKVKELMNEVEKHAKSGEAMDIGRAAFKTNLNLLSTTFFSMDIGDDSSALDMAREIKEAVWNVMNEVGKPNVADYFPFLKKFDVQGIKRRTALHMTKSMDLFDQIIDERLKLRSTDRRDSRDEFESGRDVLDVLVDMIIAGQENVETRDIQLRRDVVEHLLLDLFSGGTETTSTTLEWAMAELLRNPKKLSKAREEVTRVIGRGNRVEESHVDELTYIQSVIKETLRLHPPLPLIPREVVSDDFTLCGYTIPKGTRILFNLWAIGRDSAVWADSGEFSPERFVTSDARTADSRIRNCEFFPFGGGRRICPGLPMATRMLHLMLSSLILEFDWKLEHVVSPEGLDMSEKFGLSLRRACPLRAFPLHN